MIALRNGGASYGHVGISGEAETPCTNAYDAECLKYGERSSLAKSRDAKKQEIKMFCVVTKVPDPETESGNLAAAMVYADPESTLPKAQLDQLRMAALINLRQPVFVLGEIMVLDANDRDYGRGRKPSKWFIECETCATVEEAIEISRRVTEES